MRTPKDDPDIKKGIRIRALLWIAAGIIIMVSAAFTLSDLYKNAIKTAE